MARWLWLVLVFLVPAVQAEGFKMTAVGAENRLIIGYRDGVSQAQQKQIAEAQGLEVLDSIPSLRILLVRAPSGMAKQAVTALATHPSVWNVEFDVWRKWIDVAPAASYQATHMPAVMDIIKKLPKFTPTGRAAIGRPATQEGEVPWGVARLNAPAAWSSNQGAGVKVAVIDTGISPNHPDLRVVGGHNALDKEKPWHDDHFHGTHVAGTIAAALNSQYVVGVAPKATLYAVKVLSKDGSGSLFSIMGGIMWTAQNGIQVANMSLGSPQEIPFLQFALKRVKAAGVVVIAAAGNDGKAVNWPGAYPETIAVSALCPPGVTNKKACPTEKEGIATFSSRGPEIDFIAPGVYIPSTVPFSHDASGVKAYSGTSMACPHVAGLAALAVAKGAKGFDAVKAALKRAAVKMPGMTASEQGNGLVNAALLR